MPLSRVMDPAQLRVLQGLLDEVCHEEGVTANGEREDVARLLITIYDAGVREPGRLTRAARVRLIEMRRMAVRDLKDSAPKQTA